MKLKENKSLEKPEKIVFIDKIHVIFFYRPRFS